MENPRKAQTRKPSIRKRANGTPLRTVPFENGFHFYTALGSYTGITATSISEFAEKLKIVPIESVVFHFHRKDFQNWVKNTIKDTTLAGRIEAINGELPAEDLRQKVLETVGTASG